MDIISQLKSPDTLIKKDGTFYDFNALKDVKIFVLYFSAHWCPPCRQFTPLLARQFEASQSEKSQIIFVSGDRSLQEQLEYMREAHGNWPAVPCQSQLQMNLNSNFQIRGIPSVIVINATNGEIISRDGRQEIMQNGAAAFKIWEESIIEIDTSIVSTLKDNEEKAFLDAKEILLKLIGNILRDSQNIKYRRVKLTNPKIESLLLNANGAFEILFSMGFEEDSDALILPLSASLEVLRSFKSAIENLQISTKKVEEKPDKSEPEILCNGDICIDISKQKPLKINCDDFGIPSSTLAISGSFSENQQKFIRHILGEHKIAILREDKEVHKKVLNLVPVSKLEKKAKEKFKDLFAQDSSISVTLLRDLAVYELVEWFKNDFFSWVDKEKCCNQDMKIDGLTGPNTQEIKDGAGNVELYKCEICGNQKRFPRYGQIPSKLLGTFTNHVDTILKLIFQSLINFFNFIFDQFLTHLITMKQF